MSYIKCYSERLSSNHFRMHLWEDTGYKSIEWYNHAYQECNEEDAEFYGINGEPLHKINKWYFSKNPEYKHKNTPGLHFHDIQPHQKFLIERYGTNDEPSKNHKEVFFDIEIEIGGALTEEYIERAPMPVTSIAWYYKQEDKWAILILDKKSQLKHTKAKNREIIPCSTEQELLLKWLELIREIDPDILIGYNSDFFDIPYLFYRIDNTLGPQYSAMLSPLGKVECKRDSKWWIKDDQPVNIVGIESLDYMRLHKKYSWRDEPSWKLDVIGEKYVGVNKVEYEGTLDDLFANDIYKFIEYNFVDVKILKLLDEKLQYIGLTKNISHKGKHNYSEVYHNSVTQDGAISAYLLSQNIIPPPRDPNPRKKKNYAGGYLFCPKAGLYKYMFDEDLTSLYPSIIMSLNIGKETFVGRIIDADDRNNRLGLNDLKELDQDGELLVENAEGLQTKINTRRLIAMIEQNNLTISANGSMFRTDKESVLSTILNKWFKERVEYKTKMKQAYKSGNKEKGEYYHLMQYTMKILLNSLYGATALPNFRYGMSLSILSEAITLSGHRIIQESALAANRHMNKVINNKVKLEI